MAKRKCCSVRCPQRNLLGLGYPLGTADTTVAFRSRNGCAARAGLFNAVQSLAIPLCLSSCW